MRKSKAKATSMAQRCGVEVNVGVRKLLLSEMEMNRRRQNIVENVLLN